mmetsp:Transcript_8453/g.19960  ORF Transcript_8453/g.19960 Transcript_8453/m.19960 type:complete len:240 (-) Transcript_8453:653-1372(-)
MSATLTYLKAPGTFLAAAPAAFHSSSVGVSLPGARMTSKPFSYASTMSMRPSLLMSARATSVATRFDVESSVKMVPSVAVGLPVTPVTPPVGWMPEVLRPGLTQIAGGLPSSASTRSESPSPSMSSAFIALATGTLEPSWCRPSAWTELGLLHQPFKAMPVSSATRPSPGLYRTKMSAFWFAVPELGWLITRSLSPSPSTSTPTMDVGPLVVTASPGAWLGDHQGMPLTLVNSPWPGLR